MAGRKTEAGLRQRLTFDNVVASSLLRASTILYTAAPNSFDNGSLFHFHF